MAVFLSHASPPGKNAPRAVLAELSGSGRLRACPPPRRQLSGLAFHTGPSSALGLRYGGASGLTTPLYGRQAGSPLPAIQAPALAPGQIYACWPLLAAVPPRSLTKGGPEREGRFLLQNDRAWLFGNACPWNFSFGLVSGKLSFLELVEVIPAGRPCGLSKARGLTCRRWVPFLHFPGFSGC